MTFMKLSPNEPAIILVSDASLQTSMLSQFLINNVISNIFSFSKPQDKILDIKSNFSSLYFLVDLANINEASQKLWRTYLFSFSSPFSVILLNIMTDNEFNFITQWPHCRGVFYSDDTPSHLVLGIKSILTGEVWLPRRILNKIYLNINPSNESALTHILSAREIQILKSLQAGLSNKQVADKLFLSENTIKSHVYRIFKKLGVNNRVNALRWLADKSF